MRKYILLLLLTFAALAFTGCGVEEEKNIQQRTFALMSINGEDISEEMFYKYVSFRLSEVAQEDLGKEGIKSHLIKDFTIHRLLLAEAVKKNILVEQGKLDMILSSMKTINGQVTVTEFENRTHLNIDCLKEIIEQRLIVDKLLETMADINADISEKELKDFYKKKYEHMKGQKKAHLLHIITYRDDLAAKAMEELSKGVRFEDVAKKYSVSPEKHKGGDLGLISVEENPEIFKHAFKLKPGQISKVIKSDYGYHIFKVLRYKNVHVPDFETSKPMLQAELYEIKQQKTIREYINELYEKAEINFHRNINLSTGSFVSKCGDN